MTAFLWLTLVSFLSLCQRTEANRAPDLTSPRTLAIRGITAPGQVVTAQLRGKDFNGDSFTYSIVSRPASTSIGSLAITQGGILSVGQICRNCTGTVKFTIELKDTKGSSKTYIMTIKLKDRTGPLSFTDEIGPNTSDRKGLLRWHIYLIILCTIIAVGVLASILVFCCCKFKHHAYGISPKKKSNKITINQADKADEPDSSFTRTRAIDQATKARSAESAPYYGVRKDPNAPVPLRLMSISEESGRGYNLLQPLRDSNALLTQRRWQDISMPQKIKE